MKKILITGIDGFLGSHLANHLKKSYDVIGILRNKSFTNRINKNDFILYDSKEEFHKIFIDHKIDIIIHAATKYEVDQNREIDLVYTNICMPLELIRHGIEQDKITFINTDTFFTKYYAKYDYLKKYTITKKTTLELLKQISHENSNCKIMNMVIFHMYGPNDNQSKFIPSITASLLKPEKNIKLTEGTQQRDFIYIDDVCKAYEVIIESNDDTITEFEEFEVGTGKTESIKRIVQLLKMLTQADSRLDFGFHPTREGEQARVVSNPQKLLDLGWKAKTELKVGLQNVIKEMMK